MEIDKKQITRILERYIGRKYAIKRRDLLELLNIENNPNNDRVLRKTIEEMKRSGFPVCSATSAPSGYYLPSTLAEVNEGIEKYRSYVKDMCITIRALKKYGTRYVQAETQRKLF